MPFKREEEEVESCPGDLFFFKGWLTGSGDDCCRVKDAVREGRARGKKYEGAVISFFFSLPSGSPQLLFSLPLPLALSLLPPPHPSLAITSHCHSSPPITPNHSCRPPSLPLSPTSFFPPFNPHKWLSETGQVLQNSPWSSTCLIQGLAHCTKTSNTLPTHREGHSLRSALRHTHTPPPTNAHTLAFPPTDDDYKPVLSLNNLHMYCMCNVYVHSDTLSTAAFLFFHPPHLLLTSVCLR